jgi:hypothetical protein
MKKLLLLFVIATAIVPGAEATTAYTTIFPLAENPISEGAIWMNGLAAGLDWSDVRTTAGLAYGTQSGLDGYNDSIAILHGTWTADQPATFNSTPRGMAMVTFAQMPSRFVRAGGTE